MKRNQARQYFLMAIGVSVVIALFIHLTPLMESLAPHGNRPAGRGGHVVLNMIVTALVSFCTFTLNYIFVKPLHTTARTTTREAIIAMLITLAAVILLSDVFFALLHNGPSRMRFFQFNFVYTMRDLVISLVILGGIFFVKAITDRQGIRMENERLKHENLQSKYESLKNQLSPHFMFNSLSALKSLVQEDTQHAQSYIDHLSHVLRYSLGGSRNRTVPLSDELEVVNSYLYLVKMRYEANLQVEITIDPAYNQFHVPPLSLQTLVENAIKHNVISKKHPLSIRIFIEDESLVVVNSVREKYSEEQGTGIGLPNLANQYELLGKAGITITKTADTFRVELPLLKPTWDESSNR